MHKHKLLSGLTLPLLAFSALSGCALVPQNNSMHHTAAITSVPTVNSPENTTNLSTTPIAQPKKNTDAQKLKPIAANLEPVQTPGLKVDGEYSSLWDVIRTGFTMNHYYEKRNVQDFVKFYSKNGKMLERMTTQANPYLYYIVGQLQKRNMPTELALLPIVESGFNPHARSWCGALGLWQLMPAAAHRFDANDNHWFSGRESIQQSTNAALNYLQYLYNFFNGNWVLALAAYNAGEGTVQKAIQYNQRRDRPTDYWNLRLPIATKNYVPQLMALAIIFNDPKAYGVHLPTVENKKVVGKAIIHQQMSLAQIAKFSGVKESELKVLNPGLTHSVTPPSYLGKYSVNLPIEKVKFFEAACAANPGVTGLKRYELATAYAKYHVKRGDSLYSISHKTGVSVAKLKATNHLHDNDIRIGQVLRYPVKSSETGQYYRKYRVERGDSLYSISHVTGTSIAKLKSYNNLHNNNIRVGQVLRYPVDATSAYEYTRYEVKRGDTLSHIARDYHVNVFDIMQWNNLKNANQIHPGQHLVIRHKVSY